MKPQDFNVNLASVKPDPRGEYSTYKKKGEEWRRLINLPIKQKNDIDIEKIKYSKSFDQETQPSPYDLFEPSSKLTRLANKYMLLPSEEEAGAYNIMNRFYEKPEVFRFDIKNLASIISHEVDDFLTDWACQIDTADETNFITRDQEFTYEVCLVLIDRLQLNPGNPRPVLDLLLEELIQFFSKMPRQRSWGQIVIKDFEIYLEVNKEAFAIPKIESLDKDRWI